LELLRAFADFDRPNLACPVVDVLEEMAMNGLQVSEIKFALRDTLPASLHSQPSFDFVQLRWIK
jgi:hypothetical protein